MDRWYMVFDEDLHKNRDMSLYFLWKLYVEFILHKHVNYIDFLEFQGVVRGMPKIESMRGLIQTMYVTLLVPETHLVYIPLHLVCWMTHKLHYYSCLQYWSTMHLLLRDTQLLVHLGVGHHIHMMVGRSHQVALTLIATI